MGMLPRIVQRGLMPRHVFRPWVENSHPCFLFIFEHNNGLIIPVGVATLCIVTSMTRFKGIELLATAGRESKSPAERCQRHLCRKQHSLRAMACFCSRDRAPFSCMQK